jgi:hypothetical protein
MVEDTIPTGSRKLSRGILCDNCNIDVIDMIGPMLRVLCFDEGGILIHADSYEFEWYNFLLLLK